MSRLWSYLVDPDVKSGTQTCRIKVWAHDNAFTLAWITGTNMVGWLITVIVCHG